jgi:hypothetical protein
MHIDNNTLKRIPAFITVIYNNIKILHILFNDIIQRYYSILLFHQI